VVETDLPHILLMEDQVMLEVILLQRDTMVELKPILTVLVYHLNQQLEAAADLVP
jgi:hypothetical protein